MRGLLLALVGAATMGPMGLVGSLDHRSLALRASAPGTVTDLTVVSVADTTATLTWTEVASGTTAPARYSVRSGLASGFSWGATLDGPQVAGTSVTGGPKLSVIIVGLKPSTSYTFQLVAYTGTLNVNATFGGLSNTATAATVATPPPVPPPQPPYAWAWLVLLGCPASGPGVCTASFPVQDSTGAIVSHIHAVITVP